MRLADQRFGLLTPISCCVWPVVLLSMFHVIHHLGRQRQFLLNDKSAELSLADIIESQLPKVLCKLSTESMIAFFVCKVIEEKAFIAFQRNGRGDIAINLFTIIRYQLNRMRHIRQRYHSTIPATLVLTVHALYSPHGDIGTFIRSGHKGEVLDIDEGIGQVRWQCYIRTLSSYWLENQSNLCDKTC